MKKGKLIVIDGTDGTGKGTQTELLKKRLKELDYKVFVADFPRYGKKSAGMVEEYLNGNLGTSKEVGAYRASILYATDRYAASFEIKERIEQGYIVLSNRYVSANMGHQAGKIKDLKERDKYLEWLEDLEFNIFGIPKPDLNILLFASPEINQKLVDEKDAGSREYINGKKRDIHEADKQHLQDAFDSFLYVADKYDWVKIDCLNKEQQMRSRESINKDIFRIIKPVLDK